MVKTLFEQGTTVDDGCVERHRPRARHWWIPQLLLSNTLALFLFRIVLVMTVATAVFLVWFSVGFGGVFKSLSVPLTVGAMGMAVHHIGTAFAPRLFPLPMWLDLCLISAELAGCIFLAYNISYIFGSHYGLYSFIKISLWSFVGFLGLLLLLRAVRLLNERPPNLLRAPVRVSGPLDHSRPWWEYPAHAIFGSRIWRASVPGESVVLSLTRGILALLSICVLLGFGVRQTILLPIFESRNTPYRVYRSSFDWGNYALMSKTLRRMDYKILLVWFPHMGSTGQLTDAVTATARWPDTAVGVSLTPCTVEAGFLDDLGPSSPWRGLDVAVATCHNPAPSDASFRDVPNFEIRVNYTGILGDSPTRFANRAGDAMRVYLGFTEDMTQLYRNTDPVTLFPGTNMLSVASFAQRVRLRSKSLAVLGLESKNTFLVASIEQTVSNPFTGPAPDANISTLTFTLQNLVNEWTVIQDYPERSVVSGLSELGGFGSFLSTLLAILLGTSLVQLLFRTRPSSPFGFLHGIEAVRRRMVEKCEGEYPALRDDLLRVEKERGLLAFLLSALIDVEPLRSDGEEDNARTVGEAGSAERPAHDRETGEREGGAGGHLDGTHEESSETDELMRERSPMGSGGVV